ncbi:MAG: BACON domain-containing protein [Prevotella sp.]|nr:BACON domain-containing protein [Prevotella sp.]
MKRYLTILVAMLAVSSMLPVSAQQIQDALYIFRNDGKFSAFFFGDIDHIEYSRIDTLGVEHDDYVVQEIHALDSVFRIPVSAIDSVAFTTPETIVKADVFCPDKSIADYIVASDSVYWIRLATNTPAALIPKVGDKLLIEDESRFIPDGFGGLVTAVTEGSDGITVMTSALALTDIYEQLYVKMAGASPGMQPVQARRRGPLDGVDIQVPEDEIVIPPVSETISLKNSQALLPDNSYVELNGEVQGSVSLSVNTKMRMRAFLTITPFTGFRYYQETFFDTETESALAITGGLSGRLEVPFLPSPTHTYKKGPLKVELGLGLFLEAQATALSLTLKNSKSQKTRVNMTLEEDDINMVPPLCNPFFRWSSYCDKDTTELDFKFMGQYSVGLGAFAKAEAKFKIPIEKTPKFVQAWTNKDSLGFKATLGLDVGTKLEYAGPIVPSVPIDPIETIPFYKELNEGSVSVSAYLKFVAGLNLSSWTAEYTPEVKFWEPISSGLVPNFLSINVAQDQEEPIRPYRLLLSSTTEGRPVLLGQYVGFAVLDADQKVVKDSLCAFYWVSPKNEDAGWMYGDKKNAYDCVFNLDPAKDEYRSLTAYPIVRLMGQKLLSYKKYEFKLDPARIDIAQREIFVGKDLGYQEIEVIPNMENVEVRTEGDWLEEPSWLAHRNQLTVYWTDLPKDVKDRRGVIRLIGKSHDGETLVEDSIVVVQYESFMELTPDKLEFSEKGGTKTVTIGKTNVTGLKVSTNSEDIKATLEGKTITVTMEKNTTEQQRGGMVYVEGTALNKKTVKFSIPVTQKEGQPVPQGGGDLELTAYSIEASSKQKRDTLWVNTPDVQKVEFASEQDFVSGEFSTFKGDKIIVMTNANYTTRERYATLTATATLKDGSTRTATIVIRQEGYFDVKRAVYRSRIHQYSPRDYGDLDIAYSIYTEFSSYGGWSSKFDIEYDTSRKPDEDNIHYEAHGTKVDGSRTYYYSISFDLPDGKDSKVIKNLVYTENYDAGTSYEKLSVKATNIPIYSISSANNRCCISFKGTEKEGVEISEFTTDVHQDESEYGPERNYHDTLLHNDENEIELTIDFYFNP